MPRRLDLGPNPESPDTHPTADESANIRSLLGLVAKSDEHYEVTLRNSLKTFDANTATIDQIVDILATLLTTLKAKSII